MNYLKIYASLTNADRLKGRSKKSGIYEKHHILPKSLGGTNDKSNLVLLTPREHYLAHWLLFKIYSGADKAKMAYAFFQMTRVNSQHSRQITSRQYERAREAMSIIKGELHPAYGRTFWDEEQRSRMSVSKLGELNPMFGKVPWNRGLDSSDPRITAMIEKANKTRKERFEAGLYGDNYKMSEYRKQRVGDTMRGKSKSEEHRRKLSEALKGRKPSPQTYIGAKERAQRLIGIPHEIVTCPHCDKQGGIVAMKRWHFDNCKSK